MNISTLIFDLGNTLVPFSFRRLEPWLLAHRETAMGWAVAAESGKMSRGELQTRLCDLTGIAGPEYEAWWNSIFEDLWLIPPEWIERWRSEFRLGLMSNTNPSHFAFLDQRMGLRARFDFQVLSYEVGAGKPEAAIFEAAEARAACAPDEIFYLDDLPEYVSVARARGWQAEVFTGANALPRWLREFSS